MLKPSSEKEDCHLVPPTDYHIHWDLKSVNPKSQQMPATVDRRQQVRRSLFRPSHKDRRRALLRPSLSHQLPHHPLHPTAASRRSVLIVTVHFRWARESVLRAEQLSNSSLSLENYRGFIGPIQESASLPVQVLRRWESA